MSWVKGLAAGATGAAGYTAYKDYTPSDLTKGMWGVLVPRNGDARLPEVQRLQDQLSDLQKWVMRSQQDNNKPIVINTGTSKGWGVVIYPVAIGGCLVLYCRFVKGWRLRDLFYVTQGALNNFKEQVSDGLTKMQGQMKASTEQFMERMGRLSKQSKELLQHQQVMDESLQDVKTNVDSVRSNVDEVHTDVRLLQTDFGDMRLGIERANQGIMALCAAVAEVARKVGMGNGRYTRGLDSLVHSTNNTIGNNANNAALPSTAHRAGSLQTGEVTSSLALISDTFSPERAASMTAEVSRAPSSLANVVKWNEGAPLYGGNSNKRTQSNLASDLGRSNSNQFGDFLRGSRPRPT